MSLGLEKGEEWEGGGEITTIEINKYHLTPSFTESLTCTTQVEETRIREKYKMIARAT